MTTPEPQWRHRLDHLETTMADVLARLEGLEQAWMRDMEQQRRSSEASAPPAPASAPADPPPPGSSGHHGQYGPPVQPPQRLSTPAYPTPPFPPLAHSAKTPPPEPSPTPHRPTEPGSSMPWGRSGADAPFSRPNAGPPLASPHPEPERPRTGATAVPDREAALNRLRQWGMAPPKGADNMETHLAMWWFTRLGALALVIGFAFAGVHMSQYTSPWLRFLGLLVASTGVTVAGATLKGRLERFGDVVFGAGLALLYFCAFAAYVVPAVKVMDHPALAVFWQFAAVGALVGGALWRRSPVIAAMGVLLGYVACGFALAEDMSKYALMAALALGAAALFFHLARRWTAPLIIAIPGSLVLFTTVLLAVWAPDEAARPGFVPYLLLVLTFALLYAGGACAGEWRGVPLPQWTGRVLLSLNSFGFLGLGFLGVVIMHEAQLSAFYFTTGAVWVGLALAHHLAPHPGGLVDLYLVKGSALLSMGVITEFDARTRWIVLAVQSLATFFSVRRTRAVVMEGFMALVWILSFLFFFHDLERMGLLEGPQAGEPLALGYLLAGVGYVALSLVLFCLYGRWADGAEPQREWAGDLRPLRRLLLASMAVILGFAVTLLVRAAVSDSLLAPGLVLAALALAATPLIGRHWSPLAAAVPPLLAGHFQVWDFDTTASGVGADWFASLSVTALTLATAGGAALATARMALDVYGKRRAAAAEGALHLLWILTLAIALHRLMAPEGFILALAALALALLATSPVLPWRGLTSHATAPLAVAAVGLAITLLDEGPALWSAPMSPWLLGGALLCVLPYAILATSQDPRLDRLNQPAPDSAWGRLLIPTILIVIAFALTGLFPTPIRLAAYGTLAGGLAVAAPTLRAPRTATMALGLMALAHLHAAGALWTGLGFPETALHGLIGMQGWNLATTTGFAMALLLAAATLALAALVRQWAVTLSRDLQDLLQGLGGLVFLIVVFALFLAQDGFRNNYATVFWGLGAIAALLTGFAVDGRDLRLLGLAALLICMARAFVVDMQSALERIFAFIILGLVMLFVGYLYTRRQNLADQRQAGRE